MRKRNIALWVALIFLITLGIRLYFAFSVPSFNGDESYFSLKQIEHISEHGIPLVHDSLSYGGKTHVFSPLFYYVMAFINLFMPIWLVAKIVPNILANLVVVGSFLVAYDVSRNYKVPFFTSALSAFVPIFFTETVNSITPAHLFFPLFVFLLHAFLNLKRSRGYMVAFIILVFMLSLTDITIYLVILAFLVYLVIMRLERMPQRYAEAEVILFAVFLSFWVQFILYKEALLRYGTSIFLQNIPSQIIGRYFHEITMLDALNQIGLIPLLTGIYIIYKYSFHERRRSIFLLLSFLIVIGLVMWWRLVPITIILSFAGLILILLFSQFLKDMLIYISRSKFSRFVNMGLVGVILIFIVTSFSVTLFYAEQKVGDAYSQAKLDAMEWIQDNSAEDATILSTYQEGSLINYQGGRANVADSSFLLVDNIDRRFEDIETIYTSNLETRIVGLLDKYDVDFILVSNRTRERFNTDTFIFNRSDCFTLMFRKADVEVYRSECRIQTNM